MSVTGILDAATPPASVLVSRHALERARERAGWCYAATVRMAQRAVARGADSASIGNRGLRAEMDISHPCARGAVTILDGQFIFVFTRSPNDPCLTLVTLYRAASAVLRCSRKISNRRRCPAHRWTRRVNRGVQ